MRHVIAVVHQQQKIIVRRLLLLHRLRMMGKLRLYICHRLLKELAHGLLIRQRRITQARQQTMLRPVFHLFAGEVHGKQILPRRARQTAAEDRHIFLVFLLRHSAHRLCKACNHPSVAGNIAPAQKRGVPPIRVQSSLDFR